MLRVRAVSAIYIESQSLELLSSARRDVFKLFRTSSLNTQAPSAQTVLASSRDGSEHAGAPPSPLPPSLPERAPPPPPPPPRPPRSWMLAATALTVTASLGGVYVYRKLSDDKKRQLEVVNMLEPAEAGAPEEAPIPSAGADIPRHVQFLLVGAGTASFAAMRAIRSARPDARVLLVGAEHELPYMRPPLSKELWREPDLAARAPHLDALSFRQWNGRRRTVAYEPSAFYTPVERLPDSAGGAAVARGWRVARLDAVRHVAELRAPGREPVSVSYDKALLATGVRARRSDALRDAAAAGRALALRGVRDAARLARELERPEVRRVAVLGGGFLASELSAALAERLAPDGRAVLQLFREAAPLGGVLPPYLAAEAARRLREAGVTLLPRAHVLAGAAQGAGVLLRLASGEDVRADLVVECVGSEVDDELARASGLETHPELGGLLVNAELQARTDLYAAGDVACFYDVVLGRRRVEHHDHAVVSGRLAGENMAAVGPPKHYTHQSMFWSDLGPQLGYEVSAAPAGPARRARLSSRPSARRPSASSTRGCPPWACSPRTRSRTAPPARRPRRPRARRRTRSRTARRTRCTGSRPARRTSTTRRRGATSAAWCSTCATSAWWACCCGTCSTACTWRARCWRRASSRTCSRWRSCSRCTRMNSISGGQRRRHLSVMTLYINIIIQLNDLVIICALSFPLSTLVIYLHHRPTCCFVVDLTVPSFTRRRGIIPVSPTDLSMLSSTVSH